MSPRVYEFEDENKAINYYKAMLYKIAENAKAHNRIWYEVTLQSSNLTGKHLVTVHIGVVRSNKDYTIADSLTDDTEMP